MKNLLFILLSITILNCNSKKDNTKTSYNLKDYYYPFNENLTSTTYKYEIKSEFDSKIQIDYEYLNLRKYEENKFLITTLDSNFKIKNRTVFKLNKSGVKISSYFMKTASGQVENLDIKISPKVIFPWNRQINDRIKNKINISRGYYEFSDKEMKITSSFTGIQNIINKLSKESRCAHFTIITETLNDKTITEIYNLKGIGLYKSIEKNSLGDIQTKTLIEISYDRQ